MKSILLAFLLLTTTTAYADEWRTADIWREGVWQTLNLVDGIQTEKIARNPGTFSEVGTARTFIGAHPSVDQVRVYFLASALVHYATASILPAGWRDAYQYASIAIEYDVVSKNVQIHGGLKIPF